MIASRTTASSLPEYDAPDACMDEYELGQECDAFLTAKKTTTITGSESKTATAPCKKKFSFSDEETEGVSPFSLSSGESPLRSPKYDQEDVHGFNSDFAFKLLLQKQTKNRFFNPQAHHVAYRTKVISWMANLVKKFEYNESTFHFAVGYFDAVLSLYTVTLKQIKLISYICLYIAAKMEERDGKIPSIDEAFKLFDNEFSSNEIINCEKLVFKILDYQLNIKTPYTFTTFFLSKGILLQSELPLVMQSGEQQQFVEKMETLINELICKSLNNYAFYRYSSIAIAASAVALARQQMGISCVWSEGLQNLTMLSWESINECFALLESESRVAA